MISANLPQSPTSLLEPSPRILADVYIIQNLSPNSLLQNWDIIQALKEKINEIWTEFHAAHGKWSKQEKNYRNYMNHINRLQ